MFQPLKMDQIFRLPVRTRVQRRGTGSVRDLKTAATERSFLTLHRIWLKFFNTILSIFCQLPLKGSLCYTINKILTGNSIDDYIELIFKVVALLQLTLYSNYISVFTSRSSTGCQDDRAGLAEVQLKTLNGDAAILDMTTMTSSPYTASRWMGGVRC